MLEQKDLEAIASLLDKKLDERFSAYDKKLDERFSEYDKKLDERFEKSEQSMKDFICEQITNSEAFLLGEMERMSNSTNSKIELMQKNIDELTQYYRITRLENDNTTLLLRIVTKLQEDVEELKKKTA